MRRSSQPNVELIPQYIALIEVEDTLTPLENQPQVMMGAGNQMHAHHINVDVDVPSPITDGKNMHALNDECGPLPDWEREKRTPLPGT